MRIFRAVCLAVAASGAAALIGAVPAGAAVPAPGVTTVDSLATVSCTASVTILERYEESFLARVTVRNTGTTTITSWRTTLFEGREQLVDIYSGPTNGTIAPGGSVSVNVVGYWFTRGYPKMVRTVCS